jgi:NodT family efflux transporter outer membrane factor (OMF) lipoprotein
MMRLPAAACLAALTLGACSTLPDRQPTAPDLPADWPSAPSPAAAADLREWWKGFNDPALDQFVDEALREGASAKIAALRIKEARAITRQTLADYLPIFGLGASGNYTQAVDGPDLVGSFQSFIAGGGQGGAVSRQSEQFFASYGPRLSWEIPIFARIEAAALGTRINVVLAQADYAGAQAALTADIAQNYVDARAARLRYAALVEAADLGADLSRLSKIASDAGFVAPADAADAERQAQTLQSRLPNAAIVVTQFVGAVSALRGKPPGEETTRMRALFEPIAPVPSLTIAAVPGAPADLLRMRPDIAAAEARAILAGVELGIARADLLPRLTLGGTLGVADNIIGSALPERSIQFELLPQVTMPLLGWGRAGVRVRDARFEQALITYEQTVVTAATEASGAIYAHTQSKVRLDAARAAESAAEKSAVGARAAYGAGISSLSDRLRADQQLIDARLTRIEAERQAAQAAITVYRTFGAGPSSPAVAADSKDVAPKPASPTGRTRPVSNRPS